MWGTDPFTYDSNICTAALFAGKITSAGGTVTYTIEPGQSSYAAGSQNGISTAAWGSWGGSFTFGSYTSSSNTAPANTTPSATVTSPLTQTTNHPVVSGTATNESYITLSATDSSGKNYAWNDWQLLPVSSGVWSAPSSYYVFPNGTYTLNVYGATRPDSSGVSTKTLLASKTLTINIAQPTTPAATVTSQTANVSLPTLSGTANVVSIYANILFNGNVVSSTGATSVSEGAWAKQITTPLPNGTYAVRVYNTADNTLLASGSLTVAGSSVPAFSAQLTQTSSPTISTFSASPSTITLGQSLTIAWSSTDTTSCTGAGFATGGKTSGSVEVTPMQKGAQGFSIICVGGGGSATGHLSVQVNQTGSPTITSFTATPATVIAGQPFTLSWQTLNASYCYGGGFSTGVSGSSATTQGSVTVTPTTTQDYLLTCEANGAVVQAGQHVAVTNPAPTKPQPSVPSANPPQSSPAPSSAGTNTEAPPTGSGLTTSQQQTILSFLESFGVDSATVAQVRSALSGTGSVPSSSSGTGQTTAATNTSTQHANNTITATSCTIAAGQGTCDLKLSWSASGTNGGLVDLDAVGPGTTGEYNFLASIAANSSFTWNNNSEQQLGPGSYTFKMYNHNPVNSPTNPSVTPPYTIPIATTQATISCVSGTTWDGSSKTCKSSTISLNLPANRPGLGISRPNLVWDPSTKQQQVIQTLAKLPLNWYRDSMVEMQSATNQANLLKQIQGQGKTILVTIAPNIQDYAADASALVNGNTAAFQQLCGNSQGALPLSTIDLNRFQQRLTTYLQAYQAAGVTPGAFELGNEVDLACSNGDVPPDSNVANTTSTMMPIAQAYANFVGAAVPVIKSYFPNAKIISFGISAAVENNYTKGTVANPGALLALLKNINGVNYLNDFDGIGIHIYPMQSEINTDPSNNEVAQPILAVNSALGNPGKPFWITEWAYPPEAGADGTEARYNDFVGFYTKASHVPGVTVANIFQYSLDYFNDPSDSWSLVDKNYNLLPEVRFYSQYKL